MFSKTLLTQANQLLNLCKKQQKMLVTAESCTGGLIAGLLTEIPGSSAVVERGFVTYANAAKHAMLGVSNAALERYGAVSEQVAKAMAVGALVSSKAHVSVSVTGIAGPGGESKGKPVGLVYIGVAIKRGKVVVKKYRFSGNRTTIRLKTVAAALALVKVQLARSA